MSCERSKAPLVLMEQLVMILVFALAAAVCVQAFSYADNLSCSGEQKELALKHIQEVAEHCKATGGNLDSVCELLNGKKTTEGMKILYNCDKMEVELVRKESSNIYLQKAEVIARDAKGSCIYSMEIAWQKEGQS